MKSRFYSITSDMYHNQDPWQGFISRSRLWRTLQSPAHGITEQPDKAAYAFGRAFHTFCLETELFDTTYAVKPEGMSFATKDGKAWRTENKGKEIISFEDNLKAQAMYASIMACSTARELLQDGEAELSGHWMDPKYPEIPCKMRMDWINKGKGVIVDLKTVRDCRTFEKDAWNYGYALEAGWYLYGATQITGVTHDQFFFICVEKEPPHGVMVYKASEELIAYGLDRCSEAMDIVKECRDKDEYPAYPDKVNELYLPAWAKKEGGFQDG